MMIIDCDLQAPGYMTNDALGHSFFYDVENRLIWAAVTSPAV